MKSRDFLWSIVAVVLVAQGVLNTWLMAQTSRGTLVGLVRHSELIVEGSVLALTKEKDEDEVPYEIVTIEVREIIVGEPAEKRIRIRYAPTVIPHIPWAMPHFELNENIIVLLFNPSGASYWTLMGGGLGKFSLTGNTVHGSSVRISEFKRNIRDVFNYVTDEIVVPQKEDASGDIISGIYKLGGEFNILDPRLYGPDKGTTIEFQLNPTGAKDKDGNQLSFAAVKGAVERALNTWNNVSHSYVTFSISSNQYGGSKVHDDGVSTITFNDLPYNGSTDVTNRSTKIHEIDIWFSMGYTDTAGIFRELRWNTEIAYPDIYSTYPCPYPFWVSNCNLGPIGPVDLEDVGAHEFGHGVGLGHVEKSGYTNEPTDYYARYWWEKTFRRSLELGDKAGKVYQDPDFPSTVTQQISKMLLSAPDTVLFGGSFTLPVGSYFEIESGKRLEFNGGVGFTANDTLKVLGTSASPVVFTSSSPSPSRGDWNGITLYGAGSNNSVIKYSNVTYAKTGIWLDDAEPQIENCTIEHNSQFGIYVKDSYSYHWKNPNFKSNTIRNTSLYGLALTNSSPTMENNSITGNDRQGIYGYGTYTTPVLESNSVTGNNWDGMWWRSSSAPRIYHNSSQNYGGCNVIANNGSSTSYDGIRADLSSYPQLGSPGNNKIYNNTGYEVANRNGGSTWINAKNNWWGSSSGPDPSDFYGPVIFIPYLTSEPCGVALNDSPFKLQMDFQPLYFATMDLQSFNSSEDEFKIPLVATLSPLMANRITIKPEDYIEMAMDLYDQGLLSEAREVFGQVLSYFPDTEAARFSLQYIVTIMEDLGEKDQVVSYLAGLSSDNPENTLGWFADVQRVFILGHSGRYDEALQLSDLVKERSSIDPELAQSVELYKASLLSSNGVGQKQAAIQAFREFLASNPSEDQAAIAQAELERLAGEPVATPRRTISYAVDSGLPNNFRLYSNHPNPFNPVTTIKYDLPENSSVTLKVYNLMGQQVRTLVNGNMDAGYQNVIWDGKDSNVNPVSSGIYIYRLDAISRESDREFHMARKMVLLR